MSNLKEELSEKILAIIIPIRDRELHLKELLATLPDKIDNVTGYKIFVIEQSSNRKFNKGKVINSGFDILKKEYNLFCFHDVDTIPMYKTDYSYAGMPTHLSMMQEQFKFAIPYEHYFGGVLIFSKSDFEKINGFSNMYWGWGCEDDDFYYRCVKNNLAIERRWQPFKSLAHTGQRHRSHTYKRNNQILKGYLQGRYDHTISGLNNLEYKVLDKIEHPDYTRYIIEV